MFARTVRCRDGFANPCVTLLSVFPKWLTGKKSTMGVQDGNDFLGKSLYEGGWRKNWILQIPGIFLFLFFLI